MKNIPVLFWFLLAVAVFIAIMSYVNYKKTKAESAGQIQRNFDESTGSITGEQLMNKQL